MHASQSKAGRAPERPRLASKRCCSAASWLPRRASVRSASPARACTHHSAWASHTAATWHRHSPGARLRGCRDVVCMGAQQCPASPDARRMPPASPQCQVPISAPTLAESALGTLLTHCILHQHHCDSPLKRPPRSMADRLGIADPRTDAASAAASACSRSCAASCACAPASAARALSAAAAAPSRTATCGPQRSQLHGGRAPRCLQSMRRPAPGSAHGVQSAVPQHVSLCSRVPVTVIVTTRPDMAFPYPSHTPLKGACRQAPMRDRG